MNVLRLVCILLLTILPPSVCSARIAEPIKVSPASVLFSKDSQRRQYVTLQNASRVTEYYKIIVQAISIDADGKLVLKTIRKPKDGSLLVLPRRVVLKPMQRRQIRFMSLSKFSGDAEYYFVNFERQLPPSEKKESTSSFSIGVTIDAGNKTIPVVFEQKGSAVQKVTTKYDPSSGELVFKNTGNVALHINNVTQTDANANILGRNSSLLLYPQEIERLKLEKGVAKVRWEAGKEKKLGEVNIP